MAAAVISVTRPTDVRGTVLGNKKLRFFDITADTGTYTTGGFTVTAAQFGMKHIDFVSVGSLATSGTSGVSALGIGIQYAAGGTSINVQAYESAAANVLFAEKTSAEAYVASTTVRVLVIGN
jgi:hypothetical protein